jgi:hypothetical protein
VRARRAGSSLVADLVDGAPSLLKTSRRQTCFVQPSVQAARNVARSAPSEGKGLHRSGTHKETKDDPQFSSSPFLQMRFRSFARTLGTEAWLPICPFADCEKNGRKILFSFPPPWRKRQTFGGDVRRGRRPFDRPYRPLGRESRTRSTECARTDEKHWRRRGMAPHAGLSVRMNSALAATTPMPDKRGHHFAAYGGAPALFEEGEAACEVQNRWAQADNFQGESREELDSWNRNGKSCRHPCVPMNGT